MSEMKLKFDAGLPFQRMAIDAVLGIFEGQPLADSSYSVSFNTGDLMQTELGFGNRLTLGDREIFANLQRVQEQNGIAKASQLDGNHFSIEMETGTGKTYVYLRTVFELNKNYGFRKFVIVVPSIPIREGVLHSIATMREHFAALYGTPFDHFVYDSRQLGRLWAFAKANSLQIMVINIQAFQRDIKETADETRKGTANVIYIEQDKLTGHRPIDFLQAARPIVIIDEPQKVEGEASAAAIERLEPLCTLRYSATYDSPQKLYRLGPIESLDQKLVKRIEVSSIIEDENVNDSYVRLLKVDAKKANAQVEINVGTSASVSQKKVTVARKTDLFVRSGERQEYRDGFIVEGINFATGNQYIEFSNGKQVFVGQAIGALDDEVMQVQVYETVREHLEKEKRLRPRGIKVLSLFFIDRVANYRVYNEDGSWSLGKIGKWFETAFRELTAKPVYRGIIADPIETIHNGYFSEDRKGGYRDTSGATRDDDATYELIMRDKERLLSFDEPLRFIFSHSALREGWDNPNVFQLCTLNETRSVTRKRQEIGRGLRLPVNQHGERVHDEQVNRLTVIANESYKSFAEQLQTEYEEDCHIRFGQAPVEAFAAISLERDGKTVQLGQDVSRVLWEHLRQKGYLNDQGKIQDFYDPKNPAFDLDLPEQFKELRPQIIDTLNRYIFQTRVVNARKRQEVKLCKQVLLDPEFKTLWEKVSQRTRYRVNFDTAELVKDAALRLRNLPTVQPLYINVGKREVSVTQAGVVAAEAALYEYGYVVGASGFLPDVLSYLQNETELTRHTLARIIIESGRAEEMKVNPQAFISLAVDAISRSLHDLMLKGIEYQKLTGQFWEMRRLETEAEQTLTRYLDNLYRVRNGKKTPFDFIEYQSTVEENFARSLDENEAVKFFVKLPSWFKVDTPLGPYNPDWAIMLENGTPKLYLVRETKAATADEALRGKEQKKIDCGRKHFNALGVNYDVTTSLSDTLRKLRKTV